MIVKYFRNSDGIGVILIEDRFEEYLNDQFNFDFSCLVPVPDKKDSYLVSFMNYFEVSKLQKVSLKKVKQEAPKLWKFVSAIQNQPDSELDQENE